MIEILTRPSLPDTCPGITKFIRPTPESIVCQSCGKNLEIWSDEDEVKCDGCGAQVSKEKGASCLDYCEYANKCRDIINKRKLG